MIQNLPEFWRQFIKLEAQQNYMKSLGSFLRNEFKRYQIFPEKKHIFKAFEIDIDKIKVVILGQDPYHTPFVANGLAFASNIPDYTPPSLQNIFKELRNDLQIENFHSLDNSLLYWHNQGVMLLNSILTVRSSEAGSHSGKGWETFTDRVIQTISESTEKVVFVLWGKYAQSKSAFIDKNRHFLIASAHPSPLSASKGFFGTRPFSKINEFLLSNGREVINWY